MAGQHAILSPSSAHRWLVCTPSARFEEQRPEDESDYAREGTLAHEVAAHVLAARAGIYQGTTKNFNATLSLFEHEARVFYEGKGKPSEFADMMDNAEDYAAFVKNQTSGQKDVKLLIEHRYKLTDFIPLGFGTADASILTTKTLYVTDYKYGAGMRVIATANKQLMTYGLGALVEAQKNGYDQIENVVLAVFQPRAGGASTWDISVKDLLKWAEDEVKPKAALAIAGMGEFIAGDHCQFCKAKPVCAAYYQRFATVKGLRDTREMSNEQLADVITNGEGLAGWVKSVEAETVAKLERGGRLPGFKLVAGRGRRSFANEDNIVDILLGEGFESYDIFDPKLRSLTDLEKQFGKSKFNDLLGGEIVKKEGRPTLTTQDDDRPGIGATAADEYDD